MAKAVGRLFVTTGVGFDVQCRQAPASIWMFVLRFADPKLPVRNPPRFRQLADDPVSDIRLIGRKRTLS